MAATEHPGIPVDPSKFNQAIAAMRKRAPVPQDNWDRLAQEEQDRAANVGAMAQGDLVQGVFDALERAVRDGDTFEDFKAQVTVDLADQWEGEDSPRLEMIFRSNVMGAYNEGREEIFNDPDVKEARPFWRWELIDDGSQSKDDPCLECEDVVLPADDPWWDDHPRPLHPNCFPPWTTVDTPSGRVQIDRLRVGDLVLSHDGAYHPVSNVLVSHHSGRLRVIRNAKKILHVTANHPMASERGWVRADSLDVKGDKLWIRQSPAAVSNDRPSQGANEVLIAPIRRRLHGRPMPLSAVKLHGDQARLNAKVSVERSDRKLRNVLHADGAQRCRHRPLVLAAKHSFERFRMGLALLVRSFTAARGFIGALDLQALLLAGHSLVSSGVILRDGPESPRGLQYLRDWVSAAAIPDGQGHRGLPFEVQRDNLLLRKLPGHFATSCIDIEQELYSGDVINLEIEGSRTFIADGFLVHNCRCTFTAITAEEAGESGETENPPSAASGAFESDDWDPDPGRFDPSIRNIVEDRLR